MRRMFGGQLLVVIPRRHQHHLKALPLARSRSNAVADKLVASKRGAHQRRSAKSAARQGSKDGSDSPHLVQYYLYPRRKIMGRLCL